MWPFNTDTTLRKGGFFKGSTDWHCHILPGVDDGVQTMRESLRILADYEAMGVENVWLTPHIMEDIPNTTAGLRKRYEELRAAYKGRVNLHLAAENMMDSLFDERLEARDVLPIGPEGHHLLVETSYFTGPSGLLDILERVKSAGYHPLLAHPERYQYMDRDDYVELQERGILFQMNLTSLAGLYGPVARKKALWLLKKGFYSATGTDLHRHRTLAHMADSPIPRSALQRLPSPSPVS